MKHHNILPELGSRLTRFALIFDILIKKNNRRQSNHLNSCVNLRASDCVCGAHFGVVHLRWFSRPIQLPITKEELLPMESMRSVVDTYCTSLYVTTAEKPSYIQYIPRFCLWRKKTISHHRPFFCLTRLVHLRCAPTLFMTFARTARQNCQNLPKFPVIRWILREHTLRFKNAQYTDESIANWHCLLGQIHPCTIHRFWHRWVMSSEQSTENCSDTLGQK